MIADFEFESRCRQSFAVPRADDHPRARLMKGHGNGAPNTARAAANMDHLVTN
jgi:hypothetical protein